MEKYKFIKCHNCDCHIYVPEDLVDSIICPSCHETIKLEVLFPQHFYHFGENKDTVKLDNDDIQEMVNSCVTNAKKDQSTMVMATGDTIVIARPWKNDGIIEIIVAKNYWSADVDL